VTNKEYIISAALPGMKKEDVHINVRNGVLTLSGERKEETEEKGKNWLKREMGYGSFQRSFILPVGVHPEDVKASYKDGVLNVSLPKLEPEKKQGIDIKVD
ncbi:MAG: Hsp20/alpha crystallin family protein, partial [Elusimicrobia bacterium]|nr:Hsp20/alpha crystallin family protein [Elusimicrobiota bacterium]